MYKIYLIVILTVAVFSNTKKVHPEVKHLVNACSNKEMSTACYELGILYEKGLGVEKDSSTSKGYYKKACELGYQKACDVLENNDTSSK
jgi:hypothetical protein